MKTKMTKCSKTQRLLAVLLTMAMALGIGVFYVSAEDEFTIDTQLMKSGETYNGDCDVAFEMDGDAIRLNLEVATNSTTYQNEVLKNVNGYCKSEVFQNYVRRMSGSLSYGDMIYLNGEPVTRENNGNNVYFEYDSTVLNNIEGYMVPQRFDFIIHTGKEVTEDFFSHNELKLEPKKRNGVDTYFSVKVGTYVEPQPAKDGIEVLWDGASVGTVSYEDMLAAITDTEDITYTGYNNKNNYKTHSGKVYTLDQLLAAVGKDNDWNAATDAATLTITVDNESKSFTKGILTPARYTYDENGNRGTGVPVGFLKKAENEFFKFAYGQVEPKEKNVPLFWDLAVKDEEGTETPISAQISINTSTSPSLQLTSSLDSLNTESTPILTVENGEEGYQYEFKVINENTNAWWTIQKSSSENSCKWYAGPGPGTKVVYAFVKDANGKDVAIKELRVKVEEQTSDTDLTFVDNSFTSSVDLDKLTASSNTTLSVKATGGELPYQYRFRVNKNGTDTWYTIKGFDEKDNCTWWAGPAAGAKTIYVDVKDAKGDIARMVVPVTVGEPALKVDSITSSIPNLKASDTTTLEAEVSGAEGDVTYNFKIKNLKTGKEWWVPASDIDGNTCKWYAGPEAAQKTVTVYVKDAAGNTANGTLEVNVA